MEISFKNKTVVVIGGSRGIGLHIVEKFLSLGAKVHSISKNGNIDNENKLSKNLRIFIITNMIQLLKMI